MFLIRAEKAHTSLRDLGLLNRGFIEETTSLKDPQRRTASVGDSGLDLTVTNMLNLDVQRRRPLVQADNGSICQSGEARNNSSGLHVDEE